MGLLAEKDVPSAVAVASALNIAAFKIGIAIGSLLGGAVVNFTWLSARTTPATTTEEALR